MSNAIVKSPITHVARSPVNPQRWLLELACGHQRWITQRRRPSLRRALLCPICEARRLHPMR